MSRVTISWSQHPAQMAADLDRWWAGVMGRLPAAMMTAGQGMLVYAKSSHPWRNRTGAAEAGLNVTVEQSGSTITLHISHGVYYGIYLEGRWGGRWGVIPATISMGGPLVMAAALSALGGR